MSRLVVLDSGPLGMFTNPRGKASAMLCRQWVADLTAAGVRVVVPEIADYEVRRELLRIGATAGLARLDTAIAHLDFAPITREVMLRAAEMWASARRGGYPTASPDALDADVILAATAELAAGPGDATTVATTNPVHLARFVDARPWEQITP